MHTITLPKTIKTGAGALAGIADLVALLNCSNPLIVSDATMLQLGHVERIKRKLCDYKLGVFTDTMAEPDDASLCPAIQMVKANHHDCIIALGGGSAIDSAKAIALLATHGGNIADFKVPHIVNQKSIPVIAIPTTAGTGSEATAVTVITNSDSGEKMLCMGSGLMPEAAIIDYEFTLSLPARVAADTGIDALTHAIEAYVSRKRNGFSDQQAMAAIKLIAPNLINACVAPDKIQPENMQAKEAVMLGATLAGIAFSNASVGLVHGMSRPLGVHFHIPHGLSNAMLLPTVTAYSLNGDPLRYAQCAQLMGLVDDIDDIDLAHQALLDHLNHLNHTLQVPTLSEFGVQQTKYMALIGDMAEQALASGSPNNNPTIPEKSDIEALYQSVWA